MKSRLRTGCFEFENALKDLAILLGTSFVPKTRPDSESELLDHVVYLKKEQASFNKMTLLVVIENPELDGPINKINGRIKKLCKKYFYGIN